jgi:response regulator RpfG family c-di-GMP phosphodiesterase
MITTESILLVDDESKVLSSLSRELFEEDICDIKTAQSGLEALELLKQDISNLAVIISDYHMPGMNGIDFLAQARLICPDATRIILTGAGDLEMAVDAINRGNIYRFLIKPCSTDVFIVAVKDGIKQYQLITGERILLSKTLNGSIKVMIDILAALDPDVFAQATRLRSLAKELAEALQMEDQSWEVELSALLSRIGAVTIPHDILEKWKMGLMLDESEQKMIHSIPRVSRQLINNIPRLEKIADAVGLQDCTYTNKINMGAPSGENVPLIARILKIIVDYDHFQDNAYSSAAAFQAMKQRESEYDPQLLEIFRVKVLKVGASLTGRLSRSMTGEKEIYIEDLKTGMVLARNVLDKNGLLIVSRGTLVTDVLRYRLINYFQSQSIIEPVIIESTL